MPYYIYKVLHKPILQLNKIEQHDRFRDASDRARTLRRELALTEPCEVNSGPMTLVIDQPAVG